jgi:hypothetical protein
MNPRAPLAGSVVCMGNSKQASGVLSGPEVTTRGQTTVWMPTAHCFRKAWCHLALCFVTASSGKTGDGRLSIIPMSNELKNVPRVDTFKHKHVHSPESGHALRN